MVVDCSAPPDALWSLCLSQALLSERNTHGCQDLAVFGGFVISGILVSPATICTKWSICRNDYGRKTRSQVCIKNGMLRCPACFFPSLICLVIAGLIEPGPECNPATEICPPEWLGRACSKGLGGTCWPHLGNYHPVLRVVS